MKGSMQNIYNKHYINASIFQAIFQKNKHVVSNNMNTS
jgi:hypothetical protein